MTVTPGVVVYSVDEIDVALAQPLFFNTTFILTQSLRLMTPLLPLIAKLFNSRFEVPTMVKFCVVGVPLVIVTVGLAGEADVQLRSASVAFAV